MQEVSQSRAVLPKPPHEPVSAKLAYSKLRLLTPRRDFGRHRPARTALQQNRNT